jgi:hypothetical protein
MPDDSPSTSDSAGQLNADLSHERNRFEALAQARRSVCISREIKPELPEIGSRGTTGPIRR